jgi:hypothetical protein
MLHQHERDADETPWFRTLSQIERRLDQYLLPALGQRMLVDHPACHIARLLDHVEDQHGAQMANQVLGDLRVICNWHARRLCAAVGAGGEDRDHPQPAGRQCRAVHRKRLTLGIGHLISQSNDHVPREEVFRKNAA